MVENNITTKDNLKKPRGFLGFVNTFLNVIDKMKRGMGVFYTVIFKVIIPLVAMVLPIRDIVTYFSYKYLSSYLEFISAISLYLTILLIIFLCVLIFLPRCATVVELITLPVFLYVDVIAQQLSMKTYIAAMLLAFLWIGKIIYIMYRIGKQYRHKHMTKVVAYDPYRAMTKEEQDLFVRADKKIPVQKSVVADDDSMMKEAPVINDTSHLDATGFIVDNNIEENNEVLIKINKATKEKSQ